MLFYCRIDCLFL